MAQFWENDPQVGQTAQPAPQPQAQVMPRPIVGKPDYSAEQEARDIEAARRDETRLGITQAGEGRDVTSTAINDAAVLQGRYEQLAPIKEYRTMLPQFMQGMQVADDATGDQTLLYAYAKIMDPGSVVRESEQGAAANGAGFWDSKVALLKKEFGIEGGGQLSPEVRQRLKRDMLVRVQQAGKIYRTQRERFASDAQAYGIDPERVIGPDDFAPYLDDFNRIQGGQQGDQTQAAAGGAGGGLVNPEMRGGLPVGTNIEFGMDAQQGPFDREAALKQRYGVTSDQEAQIVAFWNQNGGNPNLTVDAAAQWYQSQGLPVPNAQYLQSTIEQMRSGARMTNFDLSRDEQAYNARLDAELAKRGFDPKSGGAYAQRAAQGLELGWSDEIQGAGAFAGAALNNERPGDAYAFERDVQRRAQERMRAEQGWLGTGAELAGGIATGVGVGARAPMTIGRMTSEGAAIGGVQGFGEGQGLGGSISGAVQGAGIGGATGAAFGKGAQALAANRAARGPSQSAVDYAQGQKFGMDLSIGDVGGRGAKMVERNLDAQAASAEALNAPRARLQGQMETAVGDVAGTYGTAGSLREGGVGAQTGARRWKTKFDEVTGKAYDAIAIPPKADASLDNTRAALSEMTDVFNSNPEMRSMLQDKRFVAYLDAMTPTDVRREGAREVLAARNALEAASERLGVAQQSGGLSGNIAAAQAEVNAAQRGLADAIEMSQRAPEGGRLSWEDLKHFRTIIGEQMGEMILSEGSSKSHLRRLYGALSEDMRATAAAQGPKALRTFERANSTFAKGMERVEGAITSLIGANTKADPEAAANFIRSISVEGKASSSLKSLIDVRKTLNSEEWGQVSSAIISTMGKMGGRADRDFSPATFVKSFQDLSPEAKNILFGGAQKDLRKNLDEFVGVLEKVKANDSTRNVSGTAFGLGTGLTSSIGAGVGGAIGGVPGVLLGVIAGNTAVAGMGKLWTNPRFVRWATGYTKMLERAASGGFDEAAHMRQIGALSRIAANDNTLAGGVQQIQEALMGALSGGPQRAVAAPTGDTQKGTEKGPTR